MKFRCFPMTAILFTLTVGCGETSWPPYANQMRQELEPMNERFLEIEAEMKVDGLELLPSHFDTVDGADWEEPFQSPLTSELKAKYFELLNGQTGLQIRSSGGQFVVLANVPNTNGRVIQFRYIHGIPSHRAAICGTEMKNRECGACVVPVTEDWYMSYWWRPEKTDSPEKGCHPSAASEI